MSEIDTKKSTVEVQGMPGLNDDMLRAIGTLDDAFRVTEEIAGSVINVDDVLGTGFRVVTNKDVLIGVPFLVLKWDFHMSKEFHAPFVSAHIVTETGDKLILNDGSTGIYAQLDEVTEKTSRTGGMMVRGGLRRSDYTVEDDKGKTVKSSTYYLA